MTCVLLYATSDLKQEGEQFDMGGRGENNLHKLGLHSGLYLGIAGLLMWVFVPTVSTQVLL